MDFRQLMFDATRLTRAGDLRGATAAIQAALGTGGGAHRDETRRGGHEGDVIDVDAVEVVPRVRLDGPPRPTDDAPPSTERFIAGRHSGHAGARDYKLYVPPGAGRCLPLVVMLHGCTQDPDDFAAGTAMNVLARALRFFVLYPAQARTANAQRCWNWFEPGHQRRGHGEPALLAAMTRDVMAQHAIDPERVYVAGFSAGGAMAAILGETYPDLYAAVGVHSGLAAGAATHLPSALKAMQGGAASAARSPSAMPTIVFHGDADATVHSSNGGRVVAASIAPVAGHDVDRRQVVGGRAATRHLHRAPDGTVVVEHWVVHGAGHAWSGGAAAGSYVDGSGPDATGEMIRFFFEHPMRAARAAGASRRPTSEEP